jgi:hypothetical protein
MTIDEASKIRGAVYISARAYNAYQMWRDYDRLIIERDLAYAAKLKLNALRVFLSYDFWLEDRSRLENSLYHMLHSAWAHKIRILPVLFECNGVEPTEEARADRDPETADCVRSPSSELMENPSTWTGIEDYVNWFMQRWSHEHRVLALEVINEPRTTNEFKFARQLFLRASRHRKILPLMFGPRRFEDTRLMQDLGIDILQIHENFHRSESDLRKRLDLAQQAQEILARPVIVAEWQRLRSKGLGWDDEVMAFEDDHPAYETMAGIVQSYPMGNFFWSLMVRPAYGAAQRKHGSIDGVFHENGAVWSLADARAISGDENFSAEERKKRPAW